MIREPVFTLRGEDPTFTPVLHATINGAGMLAVGYSIDVTKVC